jgi:hypothetical protein
MEAVGATASIIALISLALQLRDFWASIQRAPLEIQYFVEELDLLADILRNLDRDSKRFPALARNDLVSRNVIRACEASLRKIAGIVYELHPDFASSTVVRNWTSLKLALRKSRIRQIRLILEGTKAFLTLEHVRLYG